LGTKPPQPSLKILMSKKSDSLNKQSRAVNASAKWATFGKQNWDCRMNRIWIY